jgi:hypothetical protein
MKNLLACLLAVICIACGVYDVKDVIQTEESGHISTGIDPELQPFVDDFMRDCEARRTDCAKRMDRIKSIKLVDMPDLDKSDDEAVIGLCYDRPFTRRIEISKDIMDKPNLYIKVLMYHEIGHCAYGLDHETVPDAIMSPVMPSFVLLLRDWQLLLADFFVTIAQKHGD